MVSLQFQWFLIFGILVDTYLSDDACKTPRNNVGVCKPLRQCPHVLHTVSLLKLEEEDAIVKALLCSTSSGSAEVKVCCLAQSKDKENNQNGVELFDRFSIPESPITVTTTTAVPNRRKTGITEVLQQSSERTTINPYGCGLMDTYKILGGVESQQDSHPWAAILKYRGVQNVFQCGGTLITNRHVLTAAHCIRTRTPLELVGVRLGARNLETDIFCTETITDSCAVESPIAAVQVHHNYSSGSNLKYFDIGIIKLSRKIQFNNIIRPICLPSSKSLNLRFENRYATAVGWEGKNIKEEVSLPVINFEDCHKIFRSLGQELKLFQLCAGGVVGKDTCKGDSGGTLATEFHGRWLLIGVTSFGFQCGSYVPGVYTRILLNFMLITYSIRVVDVGT